MDCWSCVHAARHLYLFLLDSSEDDGEGRGAVEATTPNPFDWPTMLLAKHAQHVALIHFPIALFIVGVIFDVCATWTKKQTFATVAFFNLSVAALSVPPALLTGIAAWRWNWRLNR
ncbi:MAG TPA: DUF2231 domain-containing protein [Verrucomicrobiae bacterium]|nr:DUF2231 domain-containing protein [Verrucomicrobiae bacterium]